MARMSIPAMVERLSGICQCGWLEDEPLCTGNALDCSQKLNLIGCSNVTFLEEKSQSSPHGETLLLDSVLNVVDYYCMLGVSSSMSFNEYKFKTTLSTSNAYTAV